MYIYVRIWYVRNVFWFICARNWLLMLLLHPLESTSLPLFHLFIWTWVIFTPLYELFSVCNCFDFVHFISRLHRCCSFWHFFFNSSLVHFVINKLKMDLTSIFLFCLISLVIGAVLMILVQYYLFVKYFNQPDDDPNAENQRNRSLNEKYQLPDVSWIAHKFMII